jgi:hypothetical protein
VLPLQPKANKMMKGIAPSGSTLRARRLCCADADRGRQPRGVRVLRLPAEAECVQREQELHMLAVLNRRAALLTSPGAERRHPASARIVDAAGSGSRNRNASQRTFHPDDPVMTYETFFRERQDARYAVGRGRFRGCC